MDVKYSSTLKLGSYVCTLRQALSSIYCQYFIWLSQLGLQNALWLHLSREVRHPNECPDYDTRKFDGEAPVMLELWGMWSTSSLPSLPGPLWAGVVASDRVLSMSQIELNCNYTKLNYLKLSVFTFNYVKQKFILILKWIVCNRAVFDI